MHAFNPGGGGQQRQADLCEFKACLVYKSYSLVPGQAPKPQRNRVSKNQTNKQKYNLKKKFKS